MYDERYLNLSCLLVYSFTICFAALFALLLNISPGTVKKSHSKPTLKILTAHRYCTNVIAIEIDLEYKFNAHG